MLWTLTLTLAADLDGDGKDDPISVRPGTVTIGTASLDCGYDTMECIAKPVDILKKEKGAHVYVCDHGPRDDVYCTLYAYSGGALTKVPFPMPGIDYEYMPAAMTSSGYGILYSTQNLRIYERKEKWAYADGRLTHVAQPMYAVGYEVHVDDSFPIVHAPGSEQVVANCAPNKTITLVAEHATEKGWFLVETSGGLVGWAHLDTIVSGSRSFMALMAAG